MASPPTRSKQFLVCRVVIAAALLLLTVVVARARDLEGQAAASDALAVILPLHDEITDVTVESLKRRIVEAQEKGAAYIVFELNTPGGLVSSSIDIADLIKNLEGVKTIAWVNTNAHSGGAIVAVACDEIVMAKSSRMGDSQVIMGGPTGASAVPEDLQAKAYTPVLSEFRASCRLRGYDQTLCEAFVLPEREVWWIEHLNTGERRFVFKAEKEKLIPEDATLESSTKSTSDDERTGDDKTSDDAKTADAEPITSAPDASTTAFTAQWKLVETYHDQVLDMEVETLQPIVPDNQLLEMSAGEAAAYGFSKAIVANESDLKERYGLTSILRMAPSWSEALAFWMTSIWVRGFLMVIIMLGAYVEFHTPGVGVPGLVALIALGIFVGAPYLTGLANIWEILCLVVGFTLICLEVFVIPGFGVAGISGAALVLVGVLATFLPEEPGRTFPLYFPSLPDTIQHLKVALVTVVSAMTVSTIGMVMLSRFLPRFPVFNRIAPANPTPSDVLVEDPYRGAVRVGDVGEATSPLRPAGKARFAGLLVDVVTQGEFLDAHARVEIIEQRGNRIVVRAVT